MLSNHPSVLGSGAAGVTTPAAASAALDLISTTQGAVLYRDATEWTALTPGTAGQLLSTQGAAADPSWVSATGGAGNVSSGAATDNAIVRYDGISGETVQNSAVTVADTTGAMTWAAGQSATLTGGDSGASLVLGALSGGNASATVTPIGSGNTIITRGALTNPGGAWSYFTAGANYYTISSANGVYSPVSGTWTTLNAATPGWRNDLIAHGTSGANGIEWLYRAAAAASDAWTNYMRLTGTGNLLIGTTSETGLSGSGNLKTAGNVVAGAATLAGITAARVISANTGSNNTHGQLILQGADGVTTSFASLLSGFAAATVPSLYWSAASDAFRFATATTPDATGFSEKMRLTGTGNLLIGTTTDIAGSGGLHVAGTGTASTTTSGAFRVGTNVGLSGNAGGASYFGGALNVDQATSTGVLNLLGGSGGGSNLGEINFGRSATSDVLATIDVIRSGGNDMGLMRFFTQPSGGAPTLRASISPDGIVSVASTLPATTSTTGALTIGNGTAATNVAIGGGNINAGGTGTFGGNVNVTGATDRLLRVQNTSPALNSIAQVALTQGTTQFGASDNTWQLVSTGESTTNSKFSLQYWNGSTYAENFKITSAGAATFSGAVTTSSATLSGAGAIPITTSLVKYTSTGGAQALTLADGVDGQRLTIVHDVDGGSGVLTPTTKTGFSTVTFTNAGDTVSLVYVTTRGWMVTGSYLATIAP